MINALFMMDYWTNTDDNSYAFANDTEAVVQLSERALI